MNSYKIIAVSVLATCISFDIAAEEFQGEMHARDGNSLIFEGRDLRLFGIDAPEWAQVCRHGTRDWNCGRVATNVLREKIAGKTLRCESRETDEDGRIHVVCYVGWRDLNAWMVSQGWALAFRWYSKDYVDEEDSARRARLGLWRGDFINPWDWRRGRRLAGE